MLYMVHANQAGAKVKLPKDLTYLLCGVADVTSTSADAEFNKFIFNHLYETQFDELYEQYCAKAWMHVKLHSSGQKVHAS